jgi:hypothetical protein
MLPDDFPEGLINKRAKRVYTMDEVNEIGAYYQQMKNSTSSAMMRSWYEQWGHILENTKAKYAIYFGQPIDDKN